MAEDQPHESPSGERQETDNPVRAAYEHVRAAYLLLGEVDHTQVDQATIDNVTLALQGLKRAVEGAPVHL